MQTTCGTEDYISPEMLNGDLYTDKIDMWALGVIIYAMMSGAMPFQDTNRMRKYQKILVGSFFFTEEVIVFMCTNRHLNIDTLLCNKACIVS